MNDGIEVNSLTWRRVMDFCAQVRREAVEDLISDRNPERARGAIQTVDRLLALANDRPAPVIVSESYD
jgi:hypothetical protein